MTLNRASSRLMKRQPGSSFKPIAVYAPAVDSGVITAATVVDDKPVYMNTQKPEERYPSNFESGKYEGLISIHDAIRKSQNVVAAKVWRDLLTPRPSLNYLKKVGINRDKEEYVSLALGGLEEGVNPMQMAAAYVPFDNKGVYLEPVTYVKVTDKDGKVLLESKTVQKKNIAYKESTAYIMTSMLRDVVERGTATSHVKVINSKKEVIPAAGKTGTSSDFIDKWFVGYTPYYVGAAWYGYDNQGGKRLSLKKEEQNQAMRIWNAVMNKVHKKAAKVDFTPPSGLVKKAVCIYSGKIPTDLCAKDPRGNAVRMEYFEKGTEPKDDDLCDVHVLEQVCSDSKDIYGRNLQFGPYCPGNTLIEKVFLLRKEPYVPQQPNEPKPGDLLFELPAGEFCTVHGEPAVAAPTESTGATGETTPVVDPLYEGD
jgi:penicillin-binding protein 1A